jgi:hypothetical protein
VGVHVDEAGKQGQAGKRHLLCVGRSAGAVQRHDAPVGHHHLRIGDHPARHDIDHPVGSDDDRFG